MSNPQYPPKNRLATELPILRIEIEHANGIAAFDPNSLILALLGHARPNSVPTSPETTMLTRPLADQLTIWCPVPGRTSCLSNEPAFLYRSEDLEIPLSAAELLRFVGKSLKPSEYFSLRDRFGMAYDYHEDYNDPVTGQALQPILRR